MSLSKLPRVELALLPTPVHRLDRLTAELGGPEIWIKRDDLTGLALGGNKVRKLEYLVGEALEMGADTLVTAGAVQSNHCRQTAGAAARLGLDCILVLRGKRPQTETGNVLLDRLFGAELVWAGDVSLQEPLDETAAAAEADGRKPYVIPFGGSNATGSAAYAMAVQEVMEQQVGVNRIVVATSSGGTLAGLLAGARLFGFEGSITAIRIDKFKGSQMVRLSEHAAATARLLGSEIEVSPDSIDVRERYLEAGYGVLTELEREAIQSFARLEGILLDPVYTGRTAGGMLDLIKRGEIGPDERVLFWHTGGSPALFAYAEALLGPTED